MSVTGYELGLHCGITFAGIKAASLFWIDENRQCELDYYRKCFLQKKCYFIAIKRLKGRRLFYVFNKTALEEILSDAANLEFLRSLGYECLSAGGAIKELKKRIECAENFPHEIGTFLGYPIEDVRGFIEDARGGYCPVCGYWKIYGGEAEKCRLFERYRRCRDCICKKIAGGVPIERVFKVG